MSLYSSNENLSKCCSFNPPFYFPSEPGIMRIGEGGSYYRCTDISGSIYDFFDPKKCFVTQSSKSIEIKQT